MTNTAILAQSSLFQGISPEDIPSLLHCLNARRASYPKGAFLLQSGQAVRSVGLLVKGTALVIQEDFWGNRNILAKLAPGQLFAESFACAKDPVSGVDVWAEAPSEVLFLDVRRILETCPSSCTFHSRMIRNLLSELAEKNLRFHEKLTHMSQRTIREKLLSYLSYEAQKSGSNAFDIPLNRQQLADYLSVDRSAMSSELSKLKQEGVLSFWKNHFVLYNRTEAPKG